MPFVLDNWRCILKASLAAILVLAMLYSYHLFNKVGSLETENKTLKANAVYISGYVQKYESVKQENDAMTASLISQTEDIKDDTCHVPDTMLSVVKQLR